MTYLTAWRKGDLVKLPNSKEFRLTSDGYEMIPGKIYCNTDRENGESISYVLLIEDAFLIEDVYGRKNETYK